MERYRCPCCGAHALQSPGAREVCALCKWPDERYGLDEARDNLARYTVIFRPADERFAVLRHPILGPNGEYAIDRVALRARAYIEFGAFARDQGERAVITDRLEALLSAIRAADSLYTK